MAGLWLKHFKSWRETSTSLKKYHAFKRIYFLVELCFRDVICDFIIWKSDLIIVDQDDVDEWSEPFAWWCRKLSRYKMAIILKFYVKLFLKISKILVWVPTNVIVALENQLVKCMIYLHTYLENWVGKFEFRNTKLVSSTSNRYLLGIMYQIIFCT